MFGFKTFLLEYLTDDQHSNYSKYSMSPKARRDTDHFFGQDNDKVYGEIRDDDKSEIHRKIEQHLGHEISHEDYIRGAVKDKYNRDVRLGRVIKNNSLRDQFDRDPVRKTGYRTHKTTTVRGVEVAGQSNPEPNEQHPNGHAWHNISCKNIRNGIRRRHLKHEIKQGTVVYFVHDHAGQEIYRATLHPHHNKQGEVVYGLDAEYGVKHPKFTQDALRVAQHLSGEYKPGAFKKHPDVYNDSGRVVTLHPGTTKKHVDDMVNSIDTHNKDVQKFLVNHPDFNSSHITKILKNGNVDSKVMALSNTYKVMPQHIPMAQQDSHPGVRQSILKSRHITERHLLNAVKDSDKHVVREAIIHPNATDKIYKIGLEHPDAHIASASLSRMTSATPKHIDNILARPDAVNNLSIVTTVKNHPATQQRHINKIIDETSDGYSVEYALQHPSTDERVLAKALGKQGHDFARGRAAAIRHPKVTPEMLKTAKTDPAWNVREAAYAHPSTSTADLHKGFEENDKMNSSIRETIVSHKNADSALLTKALTATDYDNKFGRMRVHENALRHRKIDTSHIEHALNSDVPSTREQAVKHRKATPEQIISTYRHDPHPSVRRAALIKLNKILPSDHEFYTNPR